MAKIKKTIKKIHVKADLCNGCRMCELMCSLFHSNAQLNTVNPARARIQILRDPLKNVWLPVFAGEYTPAECSGRISYEIDNKTYKECAFCRAVCPSRGRFVEPDSGCRSDAICVRVIRRSKCRSAWTGVSVTS